MLEVLMTQPPDPESKARRGPQRPPLWVRLFWTAILLFVLGVVAAHLTGNGMGMHGIHP